MKTNRQVPRLRLFKRPNLIVSITNKILPGSALALLLMVIPAKATVTPYAWLRGGEAGTVQLDSTPNGRNFQSGFSCLGTGNPAAVRSTTTVGGPLGGPGGPISTWSIRWGFYNCGSAAMWRASSTGGVPTPAEWSLPATNWVMECWVLPVDDAHSGGTPTSGGDSQFMSTGSGQFGGTPGGVAFRTSYDSGNDTIIIRANAIGPDPTNNFIIGTPVIVDKSRWVHVAVVNNNGLTTFYVDGVPSGDPAEFVTAPSGVPYIGGGQDTGAPFDGYLDECRYSTFAPGAFATSDFLLRPPGPFIAAQPESTTSWVAGTAPFRVQIAADSSTTFQWRRAGANILGATTNPYVLDPVNLGDNGATFDVVLSNSGGSVTSSVATLTVLQNNPSNIAAYRNTVLAEPSLKGYFPVDNNTGLTLSNVVDVTRNGTLELGTILDGRTNRAFGQRSVTFYGDGQVNIPNNPDFEFSSGNGSIEGIVYLDPAAANDPGEETIWSQAVWNPLLNVVESYQYLRAGLGGASLISGNSLSTPVSWIVPASLVGKQTHVVLVFQNFTNVTAYADGQNLGTKIQTNGFGLGSGNPFWIGGIGDAPDKRMFGSVDELAIYDSALPQSTIQLHFSNYTFGTNTSPPTIVNVSSSKSLYAGGSPVLKANVSGTLPITYGWRSNGVPVPGANSPVLVLSNATATATYTLGATNAYGFSIGAPIVLTFTAPPTPYANRVMTDAPSAYWRLSEITGPAVDVAGFNDGAYAANVDRGVNGPFPSDSDKAAHFAGSGSPTPNVIVPYGTTLNPVGAFSVEFWAKPDLSGNTGRAVIGNQNRNTGRAGYAIYQGFNVNAWEAHIGFGESVLFIQGQNAPVAGQWYHVVLTYDGNVPHLYVNSVDEAPNAPSGNPNRQNLSVPFEIGSRFGGGVPYPGTIDEVAFYNYSLSSAQVVEHFKIQWFGATITQQPAGTNTTELSTVTLSARATGLPNTYQWVKDNVALDGTKTNFDGTIHYPGGVTSTNLTIAKATIADAGQYHLSVVNPITPAQTIDVTVNVTADTTPPSVVSAGSMDGATVDIAFNEFLDAGGFDPFADPGTARSAANYTFVSPVGAVVNAAELRRNGKSVRLFVSNLPSTAGTAFTIKVAGVRDWSRRPANAIPAGGQNVSGYVQGFFSTVVDVLANPAYLAGVTYNSAANQFEAESGGADIWDAADNFHYTYKEVSGDFDVRVQISEENLALPGNRSGIMLRQSLDPSDLMNYVTWNPGNLGGFHTRKTYATVPTWSNPPFNNWLGGFGPPPNVWLRLQRKATVTSAFISTDGFNWTAFGTTTNVINDPALLGLATCNGGNTAVLGYTKYSNYGNVSLLKLSSAGGVLTLSWTGAGVLESATSVEGPYSSVGQSQSNPQVVTPSGTQKYYRLKQ